MVRFRKKKKKKEVKEGDVQELMGWRKSRKPQGLEGLERERGGGTEPEEESSEEL